MKGEKFRTLNALIMIQKKNKKKNVPDLTPGITVLYERYLEMRYGNLLREIINSPRGTAPSRRYLDLSPFPLFARNFYFLVESKLTFSAASLLLPRAAPSAVPKA